MEQDALGRGPVHPGREGRREVQGLPAPALFLKRLSDVFDDEIERLAEEYGDPEVAREIVEDDLALLPFYLPSAARWGVINGRVAHEWPLDDQDRCTRPPVFETKTSSQSAI